MKWLLIFCVIFSLLYVRIATVVSVSPDEVIFETSDGNLWGTGNDGCDYGTNVILVFSDMGTPEYVYDDAIIFVGGR